MSRVSLLMFVKIRNGLSGRRKKLASLADPRNDPGPLTRSRLYESMRVLKELREGFGVSKKKTGGILR